MTIDDRLRAAIGRRTSNVEPSTGALRQIEEKLMAADQRSNRNRWLIGLGSAAALVAVVLAAVVLTDDDDPEVDTAGTTTTTSSSSTSSTSSTSTTEATTTTTTFAPTVDPATTVFPDPSSSRRFDSPQALAASFATDLLGFREPIVGEMRQGDSRSGEVEVRAFATGAPTTVLVRQMEDDTWFVLGAVVESIRLDVPEAGASIESPLRLEGAAYAFEGTVDVRLYADGTVDPIATTFVTGRGDGVPGDFDGELAFEVPAGTRHGVLVLSEASGEDGSTMAATVIRVHF